MILLFIVLAFMVVLSWFVPVSTVTFSDTGGRNIHPGMARNRMKNAVLLAQKFIACLPENETPSSTENYEERKERIKDTARFLNRQYGEGTFEVSIDDYYLNMKRKLDQHPEILETTQEAMRRAGLVPKLLSIRGGTDGVTISYKGFPCPNLFSGGHNGFSVYEYISVQSMKKAVEVIINIIELVADNYAR